MQKKRKCKEQLKLSAVTSFEVEQKPSVTEVEVSVVAVLSHVVKQLRVQDLTSK